MPITQRRLEKGLYLLEWSGRVTFDEIRAAQAEGKAMAAQHGDSAVVLVTNLANVTQFPTDVREMHVLVEADGDLVKAAYLVRAPMFVRLAATSMRKLFRTGGTLHFADSVEQALGAARTVLATFDQGI